MRVIDFEQHRRKEIVEALKALLEAAEAGEIQGLAYVVKVGPGDNRAGVAGVYRRYPEKALQATFTLERALCDAGPFISSR